MVSVFHLIEYIIFFCFVNSGLVRSDNLHRLSAADSNKNHAHLRNPVEKPLAVTSINSDYNDEEKAYRDNSISEKQTKNIICTATYSIASKNSSIASSILVSV